MITMLLWSYIVLVHSLVQRKYSRRVDARRRYATCSIYLNEASLSNFQLELAKLQQPAAKSTWSSSSPFQDMSFFNSIGLVVVRFWIVSAAYSVRRTAVP